MVHQRLSHHSVAGAVHPLRHGGPKRRHPQPHLKKEFIWRKKSKNAPSGSLTCGSNLRRASESQHGTEYHTRTLWIFRIFTKLLFSLVNRPVPYDKSLRRPAVGFLIADDYSPIQRTFVSYFPIWIRGYHAGCQSRVGVIKFNNLSSEPQPWIRGFVVTEETGHKLGIVSGAIQISLQCGVVQIHYSIFDNWIWPMSIRGQRHWHTVKQGLVPQNLVILVRDFHAIMDRLGGYNALIIGG